ncbi:MAG: phosphate ABC transporter ATP-binding protein [Thermoleophilaceae bacterium]|nr:phosphate ABC transporter ATP-binding protein [Thermoleophilaceae bacterium]
MEQVTPETRTKQVAPDTGPEQTTPPPVRRIVIEREPTVVEPPATNGAAAPSEGRMQATGFGSPIRRPEPSTAPKIERMRAEGVTIAYGDKPAVRAVSMPVRQGEVLALIGPSGCGKTTMLRSFNRLVELTPTASRTGVLSLDGQDIDTMEVTGLRRRVSMVFQQPNPFPMSVFDNVAYGLREQGSGRPGREELMPAVRDALQRAGLWDEVGDTLDHPALRLSGGQQQRLCIARALSAQPEVLLLDEPCSALDPRSTQVIEELILRLRDEVAVVIVTHNMQQALRIADHVGFMFLGELVEYGHAEQVFGSPREPRTQDYVGGAFG